MVERLAGQVSLAAVALAGLLAWPALLGGGAPRVGWLALGAAAALAALLVAAVAVAARTAPSRLRAAAGGVAPLLHRCWIADGAWRAQAALSLGTTAAYVGLFGCAAAARRPRRSRRRR